MVHDFQEDMIRPRAMIKRASIDRYPLLYGSTLKSQK